MTKHWTDYKITFSNDYVQLYLQDPSGPPFLARFTLAEWSQMARSPNPALHIRSTLAGDLANTRYP